MKFLSAKKLSILLLIGALLSGVFAFSDVSARSEHLEVNYLDVGQGDSVLIESPFGQNILIDGGPDSSVVNRLSEELSWWDRTIDLMVLTHPHDDHVSGLIDVLRRYNVKKVLYTGIVHDSPAFLEWREIIKEKKVPLVLIERPQTIKLGKECLIEILYPDKPFIAESRHNLNNTSIVLRLLYGENSFLFVGDAEDELELKLLKSEANLDGNILKVGHHGSDTSSGFAFLEKVGPQIAVISVGAENKFKHPDRRIIKRLDRMGIRVMRTDLLGTIEIISDGQEIYSDK